VYIRIRLVSLSLVSLMETNTRCPYDRVKVIEIVASRFVSFILSSRTKNHGNLYIIHNSARNSNSVNTTECRNKQGKYLCAYDAEYALLDM
jgi:hypothetical protein